MFYLMILLNDILYIKKHKILKTQKKKKKNSFVFF